MIDALARRQWRRWVGRVDILRFAVGPHVRLCLLTIAAIVTVSFTDVLGVSLVVPLLGLPGEGGLERLPVIGTIAGYTTGMSVRDRMLFTGVMLAIVVVLRTVIQFGALYLRARVVSAVEARLGYECYLRLQRVQLAYIHSKEFAEMATVLVSYPNRAAQIVLSVVTITAQGLSFCMFFAVLLTLNPLLGVLALGTLGFVSLIIKWLFHHRLENAGREQNAVSIASSQLVYETFNVNKLIRLRNAEDFFAARFQSALSDIARMKRLLTFLNGATVPVFAMVSGLTLAMIVFLSAVMTVPTEADLATLLVFLLVMTRLAGPINLISSSFATMRSLVPALSHFLTMVSELDAKVQSRGSVPFEGLHEAIELDAVVLRFGKEAAPALDGLSLKIPRGARVGVVGASGAGKSSLSNVLTRVYEIDGGRILVDGVDLRELRLGDWRSRLAVISQDVAILNDSVRNNLLFGRTGIDDEELMRALEAADAKSFVMEMPAGLDTVLGDRGVRLSGGQQQRLSIARALLQDAEIVILDEATSSLDSLTEARIMKSLAPRLAGRTVITIAW